MELGTVERVDIDQTMRSAYLSYAMSVITSRALPDVRDGLKPVQRRILYAMDDMGLRHDQPTRKSARIVGEVLGKYHPHNDAAVYDAMVRMAQDFVMRYPLVDGQGNFGSIDGDEPAAIRYTEARLTALGEELLADIDKDTVDYVDNFDGSLREPTVLPARLPNLLVNGVGGIAVGMATNIPPHNLAEVVDAIAYLIDNYHRAEDVRLDELLRFIPGPDFPTGGTILGDEGIRQAYATGKGRIIMRAHAHMEDLSGGRTAIIVTELPYQVNKANLVSRIATLFREGAIEGVSDLRDESDRNGMRIVIELKRGVEWEPVLSTLLKRTQMQATFGVNMLALVEGEPRILSLKRVLLYYLEHRCTVVERRTRFELERARARAHILEGLLRALDQLDAVIATIRKSRTADTARTNLMREFQFSELQAQAILDMQLRRLAALERQRIEEEYREVRALIARLEELLASRDRILGQVKEELLELKQRYGDARRTRILAAGVSESLSEADLVPNERIVVGLTTAGTVLRWPEAAFAANRGGVHTAFPPEAALALLALTSQQRVVFLTNKGQAASLPGHQLPDIAQQPQGLPLSGLLHLPEGPRLVGALALDGEQGYLCLATRRGTVKRVALADLASLSREFSAIMGGLEEDELVGLAVSSGHDDLLLASAQGKAIRFAEDAVRAQGLAATGMKGMDLKEGDAVVGITALGDQPQVVIVTARGFGKRSPSAEFTAQGRGGQGAAAMDLTKLDLCGAVVGIAAVAEQDAIALGTELGENVQLSVAELPALPRAGWGRVVTRTGKGALLTLSRSDRVSTLLVLPAIQGEPPATPPKAPTRRKATAPPSAPAEESQPATPAPTAAAKPKPPTRSKATAAPTAPAEESQPATPAPTAAAKPKAPARRKASAAPTPPAAQASEDRPAPAATDSPATDSPAAGGPAPDHKTPTRRAPRRRTG
ncbi:MAG: DNA gyrase subunit A [Anaerolineales bacterium]